jgi:hypothetical protein
MLRYGLKIERNKNAEISVIDNDSKVMGTSHAREIRYQRK